MTAAVAVFSCQEPAKDPVALGTPVPVVDQASLSETSFTVTWEAVENAVSYAYTLNNGTEETAGSTTVTFSDLTASTQYTFKVKAVAAEDGGYTDSEWASLTVTTLGIPTVAEITLDTAAIDLKIGETYLLTAEISPAEAADASITWSSSNPETASVDGDGLVTAVALGETVITATAGDKSATCTVNVVEDIYGINMEDMTADEVRAAIQDAIADGIVNIKLIGEFEKIGIPTDASVYNPNYDQNPFYNTAIELIDMTEVTGWPEVDVDGQLDPSTWMPGPDGVYGLPAFTFYGLNPADQTSSYPALREVRLPEEVKAIGAQGFWQCSALETVIAPGATHIGSSAFNFNGSLTDVEFPMAENVYTFAFSGSAVQSVSLPNAHYIDYGAFDKCEQLTSLTLTAEGDITLISYPMMGYYPFNFNTSACDLVLNADKHYESGTASPKAASENQWATDKSNSPLTWKSITFE